MATYAPVELSATPEFDALQNVMFEPSNLDRIAARDDFEYETGNSTDSTSHMHHDTMKETHTQLHVPTHPIPTMQAAFAESMREAAQGTNTPSAKEFGNASARRKHLLDQHVDERTHAARWQSKPGMRYHELWKLMAQISFGIYLLLNGIARDDQQVMNILQGHVDEVDEFLETTLEDFDLAQQDVDERLKFLKLPLENITIFDAMLEDREFRLQIVTGNERIEHVITRTAKAMSDALKDVKQGMEACKEFTIYLAAEGKDADWKLERPDMRKVFEAMKGNVDGWHKAYVSLQTKGNALGVRLVQLGSIVAEMDRRAGAVSRKKRFSIPQAPSTQTSPPASPPRQSRQMRQSMLKTLPEDPSQITPAIRATLPAFQLVQNRERTPEQERRREAETMTPDDESLAELEAPEELYILAPRTYTPQPSPRSTPKPRVITPPPEDRQVEVTKKASLRQRFSLKRKDSKAEAKKAQEAQEKILREKEQARLATHQRGPSTTTQSTTRTGRTANSSTTQSTNRTGRTANSTKSPYTQAPDSAYCSDFDRKSPSSLPRPQLHQSRSYTSSNSGQAPSIPHRQFAEIITTPRSEQIQFFRPVEASPHSPLQRPWTAGPSHEVSHLHSNSSTSNLSTLRGQQHTPSILGNRRAAPSAMGGRSMKSELTVGFDEKGHKIKKKRSAFGWLKKAFSLSEEEKAAFEEKKTKNELANDDYRKDYYQKPKPRWVDGKKVQSPRSVRSQRTMA